jgi:predicted ATPase/DNA-binding CsgD family transcriptional regulator
MNDLQTKTWIEPLSQREIEILRLISDGLSNHAIAQKLFLSDNTIKWYNKQIYAKLGVKSRTEAVSLARQFSLLESTANSAGKDEIRPQHNLPQQLTNFIGREKEIDRIQRLLSPIRQQTNSGTDTGARLVTLTGPGGVGKTRLAIQVGFELLGVYPYGVWLVELAPLATPELVPQALITLFGLPDDANRPALTMLADYLREKRVLLILDNCEHVIEACARLAEGLLVECPDLHILASSREVLGIEGEVAWKVPSLSLPPAENSTLEKMNQSEAVRLFLDRAAAALPGFELTEGNAPAVARVCRRLDGIALSIELAATRVRLLQVEQIAERLDDAFRLLTGGSRTALPRQQTLRATIDWSYNLLSEAERSLLRRMAVFVGGGRLEAIEAICAGADLEESEVLERLTQLVDKSLVMAERVQGEAPRYFLLETIRQYAREKLDECGEGDGARERHARWHAALAEIAEPKTHGHGQIEWLDRLEQEHDNLRAALEWTLHNDVELGLRTASALAWFWQLHGHAVEGYRQLAKLLDAGPLAPSPLHATALTWAAWLVGYAHYEEQSTALATASLAMSRELDYLEGQAFSNLTLVNQLHHHGDYDLALPLAEAGLAQIEQAGIPWGIRHALGIVGFISIDQGDYTRAHSLYQKSLRMSREIGDIDGISWSLYQLGYLASIRGDFENAMAYYQESLLLAWEVRNKPLIFWIRTQMGNAAIQLGDSERGKALLEENAVLMREMDYIPDLAGVLTRLGSLARLQGEYDQAAKYYSESLKLAWKNGGINTVARSIAGLAELNALRGQPRKAARLLAAVQDIPETYDGFLQELFSDRQGELGQIADTVRSQLDEPAFQVEQQLGRQMSLGDAVAYALDESQVDLT